MSGDVIRYRSHPRLGSSGGGDGGGGEDGGVTKRLDVIERRLELMDRRLESISHDVSAFRADNAEYRLGVERILHGFDSKLSKTNERIAAMEARLNHMPTTWTLMVTCMMSVLAVGALVGGIVAAVK